MNKYRSTTAVPRWLIALTMLLLVGRVGLSYMDATAVGRPQVDWRIVKTGLEDKSWRRLPKPHLYFFTANWWPACQNFEAVALSNRKVTEYINSNYVPVKVIDDRGPGSSPSRAVERLRKHFNVTVLPTLVVANSEGRRVAVKENDATSLATDQFLADSLEHFAHGQFMDSYPKEDEPYPLRPPNGNKLLNPGNY